MLYLGRNFAIATESFLASRTGYEIYKAGGNAVDAAVGASSVLTYTLPHLNGVGGDFLALVSEGGKTISILGLGRAPKSVPDRPPRRGIKSAVVLGYMASLYELHRRYGRLEWSKVISIALDAMEKATVHPSLVAAVERNRELLENDPGGRIYLQLPKTPGAPYRLEGLLRLWVVLKDSPLDFYDKVARDFVENLGYFHVDDFAQFRAEVKEPVRLDKDGVVIYEAPPPSLGFAVLLAVKLAETPPKPFSYARIRSAISALRKAHWARDKYLHDGEVPIDAILSGKIELGEAERP